MHTRSLSKIALLALGASALALGAVANGPTSTTPPQTGYTTGKWNLPKGNALGFAKGTFVETPANKKVYTFDAKLIPDPSFGSVLSPSLAKLQSGSIKGTLRKITPAPSLSTQPPPPFAFVSGKYVGHPKTGNGDWKAVIFRTKFFPSLSALVPPVPAIEVIGHAKGAYSDPPPTAFSTTADPVGGYKGEWTLCP